MPTYDYQCRDCGTVTEVIHAMTEDGPTVCDACGGPLRRVLYPAGIIFKGSGFYRTDSRADTGNATSASAGKESSDRAGSGEAAASPSAKDGGSTSSAGSSSSEKSSGGATSPTSTPASSD